MLIKQKKTIIPACDFEDIKTLRKLVKETCDIKGIGAYKIGFELVIPYGMKKVCDEIRKLTDIPIIYDHQKAGTDVPFTGEKFMNVCKKSGCDSVIIFPLSGPIVEKEWILAAKSIGMHIIVGAHMTHDAFLEPEGFLTHDMPKKAYLIASQLGVSDFVVPGNQPEKIREYRALLESKGVKPIFYSPGLISQGGDITDSAKAAGDSWHAIVGRALYTANNIKEKATQLVKQLGG